MNIKQYKDQGYYLAESALTQDFCNDLLAKLKSLTPKLCLPFSDAPWGWGQLYDVFPFSEILKNPIIVDFCTKLFNTPQYKINHLMVSNKTAWIGPEEMYHQEVSNIDTFAPGCNPEDDWQDFLQIFIALEDQNVENGCLRIIPESHKLGQLAHDDIVWNHHGHKRRIKTTELTKAYEKYGILNCEIKKGDILFFNHLLVHGSSSNQSPLERRVVIMQAQNTKKTKDLEVFNKESRYRKDFLINVYQNKIDSMMDKNIYEDFTKSS